MFVDDHIISNRRQFVEHQTARHLQAVQSKTGIHHNRVQGHNFCEKQYFCL